MNSALYTGRVRHRRFSPTTNNFTYSVHMFLLDLAELDTVFAGRWFWSAHRSAPVRFRRADHFGPPERPLDEAVRDLVEKETGARPAGRILLLTNLRHFGYYINPVSVFYCMPAGGGAPEAVVLEVRNTPWDETHPYVLAGPASEKANGAREFFFPKTFHVSPFLGMDLEYRCVLSPPAEALVFHLEDRRGEEIVLDATLTLRREAVSGRSLARCLLLHPFMTGKVAWLIYWQALKLWWKNTPFYPHPKYAEKGGEDA